MRTLLLADDNVTVQRVIALTFAAEQVRVVTAADGRQAMERMVSDRPDIVLAGTTLPEVNGYELARLVKNRPEFKSVPVLLLSGAFESVDEALLVSSGANGVIEKPVEPAVVISRVKELLGVAPSTAPVTAAAEHRPVPTPTMPRAVTTSRPMPTAWDHRRGGAAPAVEASVSNASSREAR
jgi:CheY-like chemotaxis protein